MKQGNVLEDPSAGMGVGPGVSFKEYKNREVIALPNAELQQFINKPFQDVIDYIKRSSKYHMYEFADTAYLEHLREDPEELRKNLQGLHDSEGPGKLNILAFDTPEGGEPSAVRMKLLQDADDDISRRRDNLDTKSVREFFKASDLVVLVRKEG